ncbi:aldehyde dehydrogenase family protein [Maricurvus nonylphenolicus]|uniref:aldehyde dehydrogenase family protein n=1 Tax=Maricurvus nonylphenolicus TaxID=1008307 RepID=UPI0036F24E65
MKDYLQFYIDGQWVDPETPKALDVINPATDETCARISLGSAADVDKAVAAAKAAFPTFSQTTVEERVALLERIAEAFKRRLPEIGAAITEEMGAPAWLANGPQAMMAYGHYVVAAQILKSYQFEEQRGSTLLSKEPIGVCGFITPWNFPANQIACKVAPAIATGCTIVLKPSEVAPLDAMILAEVMQEAEVPKGVFNLVNGDGPGVGSPLSSHPDVDMVSFTGSTRAGVMVAEAAAPTIKRVAQELGGKSANIILPDADLKAAVARGVMSMMVNSGQACNAPSRMFVPRELNEQAKAIAKATAEVVQVVAPEAGEQRGSIGPVASFPHFQKVQGLIEKGIEEGATLLAGGTGRPEGFEKGCFVKPTVFADCTNDMTIAQEEIFGPVLTMIPYDSIDDAVEMANDTVYGLSGYVQAGSVENAQAVAKRLRTGMIHLNGTAADLSAPFGGFKQSGNGREWGEAGFEEFLESKAVLGVAE